MSWIALLFLRGCGCPHLRKNSWIFPEVIEGDRKASFYLVIR
jgi:hypothetical protein